MEQRSAAGPGSAAAENGPRGPRLTALDGLRGTAAVVVVLCHLFEFTDLSQGARAAILSSPLGVFVNGPGAVHVFFVLSGYVLALSLSRDFSPAGVLRYWPRRVLRIHPPYVAAVLLAWAASFGLPLLGSAEQRMPGHYGLCLHVPAELLPRALVVPSLAFGQLPIGWSLWVELAMSMVFPLLLWLGRSVHPLAPVALGTLLAWQVHPRLFFSVFTLNFALGIALYLERERVERAVAGLARGAWWLLLLAAALLLEGAYPFAWWWHRSAILPGGHSPGVVISMSLGASLLLVMALHHPVLNRLFDSRLARWYGKISYSLYLVHWPVLLLFVCRITSARMSPLEILMVFPLALVLATGIAALGYHLVEEPSIHAGRALGRLGRRQPAPPA